MNTKTDNINQVDPLNQPGNQTNNVDQREIDKFAAIAASWWDLAGEFKPLHQFNPLRLDYILRHAEGLFGKQVLDVGCGGGILSESMAREGAAVTGLDMAADALQVARLHALESRLTIDYRHCTVEQHAQQNPAGYDVVTCMELLEHVPDPASVVAACAQLVKPGGHVFFSTLNRTLKAWLLGIVGAEYVLQLVPKGTHDIKKFIRPAELIGWARPTGLLERHLDGVRYNPLRGSFSLTRDLDVNYFLHCQHDK